MGAAVAGSRPSFVGGLNGRRKSESSLHSARARLTEKERERLDGVVLLPKAMQSRSY